MHRRTDNTHSSTRTLRAGWHATSSHVLQTCSRSVALPDELHSVEAAVSHTSDVLTRQALWAHDLTGGLVETRAGSPKPGRLVVSLPGAFHLLPRYASSTSASNLLPGLLAALFVDLVYMDPALWTLPRRPFLLVSWDVRFCAHVVFVLHS